MRSKQPDRLPAGGHIDRSRPLRFRFNGRAYSGYAGDTLASALLANGVRLVGRSVKFHRPRGIVGSGPEEPNAIVQVGTGAATSPNIRATELPLFDGLIAVSAHGWPSPRFDIMAVLDIFHRALAAGFYYKTFMRPRALWRLYEYFIRRVAGSGAVPELPDPDQYTHRNAHCDLLVVGGGPAGLMAALAAARCGARVLVADTRTELGGRLLCESATLNGEPADVWLRATLGELEALPDVRLLTQATVFGYYDHNFLGILERQRLWRVRAKRVILAAGAIERPLVFADNDRPGIMLASAISEYIRRFAVCPARRAIVYTNNDSGYRAALDLAAAGAQTTVVDGRGVVATALVEAATAAGIAVLRGHVVTAALGRRRLRAVSVVPLANGAGVNGATTGTGTAPAGASAVANDDASHNSGAAVEHGKSVNGRRLPDNRGNLPKRRRLVCDLLALSGGWSPAVHLHSQAGGAVDWDEARACFVPGAPTQANASVGAAQGTFELGACLREGYDMGLRAAQSCGFEAAATPVPEDTTELWTALSASAAMACPATSDAAVPLWRTPSAHKPERGRKEFLDLQNDSTLADIHLAVREGFHSVEHVKRYTALGFGTDQGKLGNVNGFLALAECLNVPVAQVGTTRFRPAYTPVTFGALAGMHVRDLYEPVRKSALHEWHASQGAQFEVVGQWLRPWYYPRGAEDMAAAVSRECRAVRGSLGIMDASTLGKIEVCGPDATTFLERIYTHRIGALEIGRCAYGIMLGEDGMVMDDGVTARLGEQHYYLTTTTGGAASVLAWLERWLQTEWPELRVYLTSVTDRWSTIAVAGPDSRNLLRGLAGDIDFEARNFPFMSWRRGLLEGLQAWVFRVSFSGELAFEINVQSDCAAALWERLMTAGQQHDITPYGTETMHVLRAEKGFVIVGQDTDGSVTPVDLGMNWLLAKDKDFLGKRSLARPDCLRKDRRQWVGLLSEDGATRLPEGAQLVAAPPRHGLGELAPKGVLGHVTSSYHSVCLGHPLALGLVSGGRARRGETVYAALRDGRYVPVSISRPVFYDPKGERQRA